MEPALGHAPTVSWIFHEKFIRKSSILSALTRKKYAKSKSKMRTKEQRPDQNWEKNVQNSMEADRREIGRKIRHSTAGIEKKTIRQGTT